MSDQQIDKRSGTDPNRSMNIKLYGIALIVALIVILSAIFFFLAGSGKHDIPKADQPNPNSRLVLPSAPVSRTLSKA